MREKTAPAGYYTIGIAALFLLGIMLVVVFGGQAYRDTVTQQEENDQTRALRSYLAICTQSVSDDQIQLKEEGGGQVLVIREADTDYGLQIFHRDGSLMETYSRLDAQPDPAAAQRVAETKVFQVEKIRDQVYAVTTDAGRILLKGGGGSR